MEHLSAVCAARIKSRIGNLKKTIKKLNKRDSTRKELSKIKIALNEILVEADRLRTINHRSVVAYSVEKAQLAIEFARLLKFIEDATWDAAVWEQDLCVWLCWSESRILKLKSLEAATNKVRRHSANHVAQLQKDLRAIYEKISKLEHLRNAIVEYDLRDSMDNQRILRHGWT